MHMQRSPVFVTFEVHPLDGRAPMKVTQFQLELIVKESYNRFCCVYVRVTLRGKIEKISFFSSKITDNQYFRSVA